MIKVFPEFHLGLVGAHLLEIGVEEHFALLYYSTVHIDAIFQGLFRSCITSLECSGSDVKLEELLVHNVDDSGDDVLYEFRSEGQRLNVI